MRKIFQITKICAKSFPSSQNMRKKKFKKPNYAQNFQNNQNMRKIFSNGQNMHKKFPHVQNMHKKIPKKNPKMCDFMRFYALLCANLEKSKICAKYALLCANMRSAVPPPPAFSD